MPIDQQLHHWKFDEGTGSTAAPSVGSTALALLVADTFAAGRLTAFSLSGRASVTTAAPAAPFTLMGWVRPKSNTGNVPLFGWWADSSNTTTNIAVWAQRTDGFGPQGVLQGNVRVDGSLRAVDGGSALPLGVWAHVALTYDGTTIRLYVNGAEVGSTAAAGTAPTGGVLQAHGDGADVDDLRVFAGAATAAEVATWMDTADQPTTDPTPDPDPDPTPAPEPAPRPVGDLDPASVLTVDLWAPAGDDTWRTGLTTLMLETWLRDHGLGDAVAVVNGPEIPSDPGALIVCTWLAGAGFSLEQMLDSPAFQLRVIGPQGNHAAARELAERIDLELVARDHWPGFMGPRYVVETRRSGGRPAHDRTDTANRAHYVCTYLADVEAQ